MSCNRNCSCNSTLKDKSKQQALKTGDQNAAVGRHLNVMAGTADARIRGHALASQRVAQAIRDGKKPQRSARKRATRGK